MIFLPLAALAGAVLFAIYRTQSDASDSILRNAETRYVDLARGRLSSEVGDIVADTLFLAEHESIQLWLGSGGETWQRTIERLFLGFSLHKGVYDKIRFIDTDGLEVVRVDYRSGAPQAIPQGALQDKLDRYFVPATLKLEPRQIYISPLDLNMERGVFEQPLKPTLRFATPVVDGTGAKRGFVMLNYFGQRLLDDLRLAAAGRPGRIWLLNKDGYWLLGPRAEDEWGFLLPDRRTRSFAAAFPAAWRQIRSGEAAAQFQVDGDLFTYARMIPSGGRRPMALGAAERPDPAAEWILVGHVAAPAIAARTADLRRALMFGGGGLLVIFALGAWQWARVWTARRHAEIRIAELNQRLRRDNTALDSLNKELEAFSYSVSHDLRAPLRAIDGFSKALDEDYGDRLDQAGKGYLNRVRAAAQRMGRLIDDLIQLSRVTRAELQVADVDLSALAEEAVRDLREAGTGRAAVFTIAPGMTVRGDARLLRVALDNLFNNACKFSAGSTPPTIVFERRSVDGEPVFAVSDNGVGFDMKYVDKLFGAFQRLHDAAQFPGTGIGLATVQRVIRKHGGRIWAESRLGEGATFLFTLS